MAKQKAAKASEKGKNPLKAVIDWFIAPRRKSVFAEEERRTSAARKKRGKLTDAERQRLAQKAGGRGAKAGIGADKGDVQSRLSQLASVDKRGAVRFHENDRILFVSQKGSKSAALQDAVSHHDAMVAECAALAQSLSTEGAHFALATKIEDFEARYGKSPGLAASVSALARQDEAVRGLLEARDDIFAHNRTARLAIIQELEAAASGALSMLDSAITVAKDKWAQAGDIEKVHLAPLNKRFENAVSAVQARKQAAIQSPDNVLSVRADLLDTYAELLGEESHKASLTRALTALDKEWQPTEGLDQVAKLDQAQAERFARQSENQSQAQAALLAVATQVQQSNAEAANLARARLVEIVAVLEATPTPQGRDLTRLDDQTRDEIKRMNLASQPDDRGLIMHVQSLLASAYAAQEVEAERESRAVAEARQQADGLIQDIEALSPNPGEDRHWQRWEDERNALVAAFREACAALPKRQKSALAAHLEALDKAWAQKRVSFFSALDQGRETAEARKTALIDRLMHYADGLSAKQLDGLLADSMTQWKAAGRASREREEELWQAYSEVRMAVTAERDMIREQEHGERIESMSAAFVRKKARLNWLEWLVNHDRYLAAEQKPNAKAVTSGKDLGAKEREIARLTAQLMDIQRKLNKASPLKAVKSADEVRGNDGVAGDAGVLSQGPNAGEGARSKAA